MDIACAFTDWTLSEIGTIRREIDHEIFDYQTLISTLSALSKPRDKIGRLLASGDLMRIKKGLYCFGEAFRREPICRETLANLLYGPSYVSLEYALGFHGLIPERIEQVTSVTTGRSRAFRTPFGRFSYATLGESRFSVGTRLEGTGSRRFLVASPEKALADKVWKDKRFGGGRVSDYEAYLLEDLRIDPTGLQALDQTALEAIAHAYDSPKMNRLLSALGRMREA